MPTAVLTLVSTGAVLRAAFVGATVDTSPMSDNRRLDESVIAPAAREAMDRFHADVVREVKEAVRENEVVVVGMAQNPHVRGVRRALDRAGVTYKYLEYGSYLSKWRVRLAIKLWSGWPTFPQVFVRGVLLGGEDLTERALAEGTLKALPASATGDAR